MRRGRKPVVRLLEPWRSRKANPIAWYAANKDWLNANRRARRKKNGRAAKVNAANRAWYAANREAAKVSMKLRRCGYGIRSAKMAMP